MIEKKRKYARFLIEGCLRLSSNDKLFIIASDLVQDFVDIVIEEAHNIGINEIETLISKPMLQKEMYLSDSYEEIIKSSLFNKTKFNEMARLGYAFLNIFSPLPNFFDGVDSELMAKVSKYQSESISEYRDYQNKGLIKWNISSVPNEIWANSLFNSSDVNKLWNLIFDICLINDDDPIMAWDKKMMTLKRKALYLNNLDIDKLIYHNSLGTNFEIALPENYLFQSADGDNLVNMPTEEVFASPDRLRVEGIVYSSKPLIHNGQVIDKFWLKFNKGKVIEYDASVGREVLKGILETDQGSSYLGEVALVDFDSPISRSGVLFKNTLYDENASCHLALGTSFPECVKDGLKKTREELLELGLNYSNLHVDFFIGTDDLEIKAILKNGEEVVIMEKGNFVWRNN